MNIEQIEKRLAEIAEELRDGNADVEALEKEVAALEEQRNELRTAEAARKNMAQRIASGEGTKIGGLTMNTKEQRDIFNAGSTEYRDAYIANLMGKELTEEQRKLVDAGRNGFEARSSLATDDASGVMPTQMVNEINDLVKEQHPIVGDVRRFLTGTILEVPVVKPSGVLSSTTSDGEVVINQPSKITLTGVDFTDYIDLPYAAFNMSIDAFRAYIEQLIAEKIGAQVAYHIYTKITRGVDSANKITAAGTDPTYNEIANAFGSLKRVNDNNIVVYATRKTVFGKIKGLVDSNKRPVFDPETRTLFGAAVKYEDTVPDGSLLIGDPSKVWCNVITDYMIESDKDVKNHNYTVSGYTRLEATLVDSAAFTLLSGKTTG